jgi:hypothetical protein
VDEYLTGALVAVKFRHEDYSKVYKQFLEIIGNIDTMPHHLRCLWRVLRNIAVQGWYICGHSILVSIMADQEL